MLCAILMPRNADINLDLLPLVLLLVSRSVLVKSSEDWDVIRLGGGLI